MKLNALERLNECKTFLKNVYLVWTRPFSKFGEKNMKNKKHSLLNAGYLKKFSQLFVLKKKWRLEIIEFSYLMEKPKPLQKDDGELKSG